LQAIAAAHNEGYLMVTSTFKTCLERLATTSATMALGLFFLSSGSLAAAPVAQTPLFLTQGVEPQVMLSMSNDHQLFFEAYPDYLDLDGDGKADQSYGHANSYYGYFDSFKCYDYVAGSGRFEPKSVTSNKYCDVAGDGEWSGNFLNYLTMSRMDVVRKILFGGYRRTDTSSLTVLERAYLPTDAHSWARYYSGSDVDRLTPFSRPDRVAATSLGVQIVGKGDKVFSINTNRTDFFKEVQLGDQIKAYQALLGLGEPAIDDPGLAPLMLGKVTNINSGSNQITVNVQGTNSTSLPGLGWTVINLSREGISFCNTTNNSSLSQGERVPSGKPPRLSVAKGNYGLWSANERWQCRWKEETSADNANNIGITESAANDRNPVRVDVGLGEDDYIVRVEACNASLLGNERCKQYPDGNYKPVGLLQQYGDDDQILFGLLGGSYLKNKSGGALRKNITPFSDELNVGTDGTFRTAPSSGSIVDSLNLLRMYGYASGGTYTQSPENCSFNLASFADGRCASWGNPQSEIFMEAIRYFGGANATPDFTFSGDDRLDDLTAQNWSDTLDSQNYCAPLNVINFNGSVASYDRDQLSSVTDLAGIASESDLDAIVNSIGGSEGINGNDWFVGETSNATNQLCTSKTVGALAEVAGLCPEAPRLSGGYDAVGLAYHAYTEDLRPGLKDDQLVKTFAVALAPAVPRIDIPRPGQNQTAVTILPACRNTRSSPDGNCAIVDFKVVRQDLVNGTGKFLVNWEDSEQGGDYDQDMYGTIEYKITKSNLTVTTDVAGKSTPFELGFGYVLSGTTQNGFHAHSGINGFNYTDSTGVPGCTNCNPGDAATSYTYLLSSSGSGTDLLEAPMFYAAKWSGYDKQANFPTDQLSWDANSDGLPDNYYFAINPGQLAKDLEEVFADILRASASAASVAANSTSLLTETAVYQASFSSERWSGDLRAFEVLSDGSLSTTFDWSAAQELDALSPTGIDNRNIITNSPLSTSGATDGELLSTGGLDFEWSDLTNVQKQALRLNSDGTLATLTVAESRLEYLRGKRDEERTSAAPSQPFRERDSRLGDIINSNPQFIYRQDFGYGTLDETSAYSGITPYKDWREGTVYQGRPPVLVVGANDGMLHGFNADPTSLDVGEELFAYVPSDIFDNLSSLTYQDYSHRYFVDGTPRIADVWLGSTDGWATLAVGSTGAGGDSIFALDITDPQNVSANSVLWEFSHPDKGRTLGQPAVVALANGEFGVVVTSGYEDVPGTSGGKIWVLNARTGRPIKTFGLPDSGELGAPLVVDLTTDRIADRIYVGDTLGKLWRLDIDASNTNQWGVPGSLKQGSTLKPLFVAESGQAITAPLTSAFNERGEHMVFFGTGSFYRVGQNVVDPNPQIESFYGVIDKGLDVTKSDLVEQEILVETVVSGNNLRVVSDNTVPSSAGGWYLDLLWKSSNGGMGAKGERVVSRALVRGDRVIFATVIPSSDPCAAGGESFLMELDASSGGRLSYTVFDVSGDLSFDASDFVTITVAGSQVRVPVSGLAPDIGIISTPTVITGVGPGDETKVISGTSGTVMTIPEAGSISQGRQNWQQMR
tara:strand:+ start:2949 stop:7667 length:4719 start_codon:yes stop_codon:yes gene_type:complete